MCKIIIIFILFSCNVVLAEVSDKSDLISDIKQKIKLKLIEDKIISDSDNIDIYFENKLDSLSNEFTNIKSIELSNNNKLCADIIFESSDYKIAKYKLRFRYIVSEELPVLKHNINKGDQIEENDVYLTKIEKLKIKKTTVKNKEYLIGKIAKYPIRSGNAINDNQLMNKIVINKNDIVNAIYKNGKLQIKISVIAQESGAIGDIVNVKNNNKIFRAIITDDTYLNILN